MASGGDGRMLVQSYKGRRVSPGSEDRIVMANQGSEVSQTRRLTKGKRVWVEVWFWVVWGYLLSPT